MNILGFEFLDVLITRDIHQDRLSSIPKLCYYLNRLEVRCPDTGEFLENEVYIGVWLNYVPS
jgi:hypothetical protein